MEARMIVEQNRWSRDKGWGTDYSKTLGASAQLVLAFAGVEALKAGALEDARSMYPAARIFGCTTAGEILGTEVRDDTVALTAIRFESSSIAGARTTVRGSGDSFQAGERLARALDPAGLVHVLVLSNGIGVNGGALVKGLMSGLPPEIAATGGLAGDGGLFLKSFVIWDDVHESDTAAVVGLYGERLKVGFGSLGGWDPFGPERLITRSRDNVLYELDGRSALELYKQYLGEHARGLPASGLLFPLTLRGNGQEAGVVRTILGVDEKERSMTFAGDVPEGSRVRLMKANFDRLIDGAIGAAKTSYEAVGSQSPDLAILISCVGRKMVLGQRVEEEVEGVREVLGAGARLTGFYSYGEISPFAPEARCELHNQTMTITTLSER